MSIATSEGSADSGKPAGPSAHSNSHQPTSPELSQVLGTIQTAHIFTISPTPLNRVHSPGEQPRAFPVSNNPFRRSTQEQSSGVSQLVHTQRV